MSSFHSTSDPLPIPEFSDSRDEWLTWIQRVSSEQFLSHYAVLKKAPPQQRALFLARAETSDQDITLALDALSRLKRPWILRIPWKARFTSNQFPSVTGARAVQLIQHLSAAILLRYVTADCLPSDSQLTVALLPLQLRPTLSPDNLLKAATQALENVPQGFPGLERHRRWFSFSPIRTECFGRNRYFSSSTITIRDDRFDTAPPFVQPAIRITARSSVAGHADPLWLDLSEPDARALHEALSRFLDRTGTSHG